MVSLLQITLIGVLAYFVGAALDRSNGEKYPSDVFLSLVYGLIAFVILYVVLLRIGYWSELLFWTLITFLVVASLKKPSLPRISHRTLLCFLVALVALAPFVLHAFRMGLGAYPEVFYNRDNAYFMQFVFGFVEYKQYPPPKLGMFNLEVQGYHYGVMAMGALLSELSGLKPHVSFLMLVFLLGAGYLFVALYRLLDVFKWEYEFQKAVVVVLVFAGVMLIHDGIMFLRHEVNVLEAFKLYLRNFQTLAGGHLSLIRFADPLVEQHLATIFGVAFVVDIFSRSISKNYLEAPVVYLLLVGSLSLFKLPYILPVALGVGTLALVETWRTRKKADLFIPMGAGLFMLSMLLGFGIGERGDRSWEAGWQLLWTAAEAKLPSAAIDLGVLWSLLALIRFASQKVSQHQSFDRGLIFLSPLAIVPMLSVPTDDISQVYKPSLLLAWVFLVILLVRSAGWRNIWQRVLSLMLMLLLFFHVQPMLLYTKMIWSNEKLGYEYANNREIAKALEHIPLRGSLIISNDSEWPSKRSPKRPEKVGRQFQITGIFGHHAFNSSGVFYHPERLQDQLGRDQYRVQEFLRQTSWNTEELEYFLDRYPITHFLVWKKVPYPENVPFPLIFESDEYMVYELRTVSG